MNFAQRGNNDHRLSPEELANILAKAPSARTALEKLKLKAHEKLQTKEGLGMAKEGKRIVMNKI